MTNVKGDIIKRQIGWLLKFSHAFSKVMWKANIMKKHWLVEVVEVLLIGQRVLNQFYNFCFNDKNNFKFYNFYFVGSKMTKWSLCTPHSSSAFQWYQECNTGPHSWGGLRCHHKQNKTKQNKTKTHTIIKHKTSQT
jgi:hypothetical protein